MRRTFIKACYRAGMLEVAIMRLSRHTSVEGLHNYVRWVPALVQAGSQGVVFLLLVVFDAIKQPGWPALLWRLSTAVMFACCLFASCYLSQD